MTAIYLTAIRSVEGPEIEIEAFERLKPQLAPFVETRFSRQQRCLGGTTHPMLALRFFTGVSQFGKVGMTGDRREEADRFFQRTVAVLDKETRGRSHV